METIEEPEPNTTLRVVIALVVLAIIAGFGSIGHFSGTGWFGYRQMLYGTGEIYLLNLGDRDLDVFIDNRESVSVPANDAKITELIGGVSTIVVRDDSGEVVDTYELQTDNSHALLKLSDKGCLVATDVTSFYKKGGADELEFVEFLKNEERTYIPESRNVIWPRKRFPQKLRSGDGPGIWIEWVGCDLLDSKKFLRGYLRVRLRDRLGMDEQQAPGRRRPPQ